jgi:predicted ATPase
MGLPIDKLRKEVKMMIINDFKNKIFESEESSKEKIKRMELMLENVQKNEMQSKAFNRIMDAVSGKPDHPQRLFFLDGPAGSGKTYLYNTLILFC